VVYFLRATATCTCMLSLAIVEVSLCPSVRPNVRLSHHGTVSKQQHLESQNLYFGL